MVTHVRYLMPILLKLSMLEVDKEPIVDKVFDEAKTFQNSRRDCLNYLIGKTSSGKIFIGEKYSFKNIEKILVYSKGTGKLVGFTRNGRCINDELKSFARL